MRQTYPHANATALAECGQWASAGLRTLRMSLMRGTKGGTDMASPPDTDTWIETLESLLTRGRLADALSLLDRHAQQAGPQTVLSGLVLDTIRRIESRWNDDNVPIPDVLQGFATARHLIDLWQTHRGMVHPQVAPYRAHSREDRFAVLVSVAPGDAHTFGAQILADDLALRGWSVDTCLDSDSADLVDRVARKRLDAVLVSIGQDASLAGVGDLVAELRAQSLNRSILILLGGSGLAQPLAQYHFLGADLIAGTAQEGADFLASRVALGLPDTRN